MAKVNKKKQRVAGTVKRGIPTNWGGLMQPELDEMGEVLCVYAAYLLALGKRLHLKQQPKIAAALTQAYCTHRLSTTLKSIEEDRRLQRPR